MPNHHYSNGNRGGRHSDRYERRRHHKDRQDGDYRRSNIYDRNRSHSTDSRDSRDSKDSHNPRSNNRHQHHRNNYNDNHRNNYRDNRRGDHRDNKYSHRDNENNRRNDYKDSSHEHKGRNERNEYNRGRGRDEHSVSRPRLSREEQYQRNYAYVIRNIGENLKKGLYKNTEELQTELDELQNDKNYTESENLFCQQFDDLSSLYKRDDLEDDGDENVDNSNLVEYVQNEIDSRRNTIAVDKMLKYGNDNRSLQDDTKNSVRKQFNNIAKTSAIKVGDHMFKAYSHIDISKTCESDEFAFCLLFSLSNLYKLLGNKEKREYRTQLYRKIVRDFEKNGYYKEFGYKDKRLSRNGLLASMMAQAPLDLLGQTLIMDYFKVNVLVYKSDLQKFLPYVQYKEEYVSVFMKYQHTKFTPIEIADTDENGDSLDNGDGFMSPKFVEKLVEKELVDLSEIVNPFTSSVGKLKAFSAYKLPELRDMAESLSIELTKVVGEKDKKKTKRELYDEIKGLYEMNTN